jgi:FkbM family methyltransferase
MKNLLRRSLRTIVSFIPSSSLLPFRELKDFPLRILRRPHEEDFHLLGYLDGKPSVVLDVGANRGQSIRSLQLVLDRPIIHAFEPNTALSSDLKRRYCGESVTVHDCGLSSADCTAFIFLPRYGHTVYDTRASLSEANARSFLRGESFIFFVPGRASVIRSSVALKRLDDLELAPTIVKIDVEGLDDRVIRGGMETLRRHQPACLIEHPQPQTITFLERLGYTAYGYAHGRATRNKLDGLNVFFLMPQHVARLIAAGVAVDGAGLIGAMNAGVVKSECGD